MRKHMKNMKRRTIRALTALMLTLALIAGSWSIIPAKAYAAGAADISVGDFVDVGKTDVSGYTGIPHWRVIDKGDDGSVLLMSEYLWTGNGTDPDALLKYYRTDGEPADSGWGGSRAKEWCQEFEEAVLRDVEGLTIVKTFKTDYEYKYVSVLYPDSQPKYFQGEHNNTLYDDTVFFLSAEEMVEYLPDNQARIANKPDNSGTGDWFLRSRQKDLLYCCHVSAYNGEPSFNQRHDPKYARPVFRAKFDENTALVSTTDESGSKTWTISEGGEGGDDPVVDPVVDPPVDPDPVVDPPVDPAQKAKKIKTITVNTATVSASAIDKAVRKAGGSKKYVTKIVLGKKVKTVKAKALAKYSKVTTLEVKTTKLTRKSVKNSLKNSKVKTVKVKVSKKTAANKKYVTKYKKIFTKKNAGRKVTVKR